MIAFPLVKRPIFMLKQHMLWKDNSWIIKRIADFITLIMWLWILITAAKLKNDHRNQDYLYMNGNSWWKVQLQVIT